MRSSFLSSLLLLLVLTAHAQPYPVRVEGAYGEAIGEVLTAELLERIKESKVLRLVEGDREFIEYHIIVHSIGAGMSQEERGRMASWAIIILAKVGNRPSMYGWSSIGTCPKGKERYASYALIEHIEDVILAIES